MKLSIITINYNNLKDLENTVKSVFSQSFSDYEYIIIDGGSTDGSKELLEEYNNKLDYWVSEKDDGLFNAMNKGIVKATGEYLLMLNSGDVLNGNTVLDTIFENDLEEDIVYTDIFLESRGKVFGEKQFPDFLSFNLFYKNSISHQGAFIKRSLHELIGLYNEELKYSSDWEFFILALFKFNATAKHLKVKIAVCNCDGLTWDSSRYEDIQLERKKILEHNFKRFLPDYERLNALGKKSPLMGRINYKINQIKNFGGNDYKIFKVQ